MYFADFNSLTGHLIDLELGPLQMRRFQLVPASGADILWLRRTLDRESVQFGTHIRSEPDGRLIASRLEAVC
jgi:poly-gamma-glutamate capsule biosynthesis protein CapA/YwtB (metallophosphatase superfamily)